jgi:hypothetical protein
LVDWAETAFMEGEIQEEAPEIIRDILGRLGLADVKEFGLLWEDCNEYMNQLGYVLRIGAGLAA